MTALGKAYPGGNPVNVAVYMRRLGMDASYTGVVGTDQYGSIMKTGPGSQGSGHFSFAYSPW